MPAQNSTQTYGSVARAFHWLTALLILTQIPLGFIAVRLPYDTAAELAFTVMVFSAHKSIGLALVFVALARILWALNQKKPAGLHPERRLETFAAEAVHWLLYGSILLVPLSGWIRSASAPGFAPLWWPFGETLPFVPEDPAFSEVFSNLHLLFVVTLVLALGAHIAGALKHHVIDRDAILHRMLSGRAKLPALTAQPHSRTPLLAALAVWAAVLIGGTQMGYSLVRVTDNAATPETNLSEPAASGWSVTEGQLAITVAQLGSPVEGSFSSWTAAINFDESVTSGRAGDVTVDISIASLTLGSISAEAAKPDYFDTALFPTATFSADILREGDAYVASGILTLKGAELPMTLPFTLEIDGDTATVIGSTTLDRRAFAIGETTSDPKTLGFEVPVSVRLSATRN
jgi:cytochrome b561/polyisoprenoid-binding protein YceI